jgi:protein-disulfide isomerase
VQAAVRQQQQPAVEDKKMKSNSSQQAMGLIATLLVILLLVASFMLGYSYGRMSLLGGSPTKTDVAKVDVAFKGEADAPVVITEWSDFECPFCARHYSQTLPQIIAQYVDTGKVRYEFKDFPLSFHPNAQKAGEAGKCALAQGNEYFWELHDKMFQNQNALNVANFKAWAREIGLDGGEFDSCLDSGAMAQKVQADMAEGQQAGVRGTPGFLINGQLVSGAQPFAEFQKVIDAKLAEA